jgi:DNA polymerase-1
MRQQAAERTAINAPMQGTAADIIKLAMISIHRSLQDDAVDARIIMQVHDELVLEVENSILNEVKSMICQRMESAAQLDVPLLVEAGSGKNWDQAH